MNKTRQMPNSLESEMSILGSILLDNDSINKALQVVVDTDFYTTNNTKIFKAMMEMSEAGENIDLVTLSQNLKQSGDLESIGGPPYLMELLDVTPTATTITHYSKIVRDKSILRKLISISTQLTQDGYDEKSNPYNLLSRAEELLMEISEKEIKSGFTPISELAPEGFKAVENMYEKKRCANRDTNRIH